MLNLVSRAPHSIVAVVGDAIYKDYCGLLTGPFSGFHPQTALDYGAVWAADNGCFLPGYNPDRIVSMLRRYRGIPGCQFIVVPDVVKDAAATLQLFSAWVGTYQQYGYPCAFVLQNGIEHYRIPWDSIACVFIGGDDAFKFSDTVRHIAAEAKRRGKWLHHGRVNTPERILYSRGLDCDSFDGTHFTRETIDVAKYLPFQTLPVPVAKVATGAYQRRVIALDNTKQLKLAI